jgi:hypothetical protein
VADDVQHEQRGAHGERVAAGRGTEGPSKTASLLVLEALSVMTMVGAWTIVTPKGLATGPLIVVVPGDMPTVQSIGSVAWAVSLPPRTSKLIVWTLAKV